MRVTFGSDKVSAALTMRVISYTFSFLMFCILALQILPLAECYSNAVLSRVCYVDSEIPELVYPFENNVVSALDM